MAKKSNSPKPFTHYHKDGAVWANGQKSGEIMTGYWEWFRKDGTKMRSGYFDNAGQQIGEWISYDKTGKVYKVTNLKPETT
jgi:antitoxin component YwqK of YwqJK toxin-antitoxin module